MWKPTNKNNKQIASKLSEISDALYNYQFDSENIGLMGGKTGVALFFYYYYKYTNNTKFLDKANELIHADFDSINSGFAYGTHAGGISGILFTLSLLKEQEFIDFEEEDILTPFDPFLIKNTQNDFAANNYDYLHGALGYGINFLRGVNHTDTLNYIFEELNKSAKDFNERGYAWISSNSFTKQTGYNLSLSHGISSIIYFLSNLYLKSDDKEKTYNLLSKAITYLESNIQPYDKIGSYFSSWAMDNDETEKSRLAWCYGDMGIAISLWQAGNNTNTQKWKDLAEEIMLHSATRRDIISEHVNDSGLCHGSAGLGLIFARMYNYTDRLEFKDAANYWLNVTLEFANNEDGIAGYKTYRTKDYGGYIKDTSFLEGVSGVGLFLISTISEIEPVWDTTILLS